MENLNQVLSKYQSDQRVQELVQSFQSEGPARVQLLGLKGAQPAFVLKGFHANTKNAHLVIANDKEEAAYLQNTLASLFENKKITFFPDSFKRPRYFEELNSSNVLQRAETINQLSNNTIGDQIIVTYPEALFEQVVAPDVLDDVRITIEKGESLDVDTVIEVFSEHGFQREDFVYEPGQYAIRGGIVDIFSYGNDFPYRIELFDDEVESIRTFNPTTQLSVKNISKVSVVPNINTRFARTDKVSIFRILPEHVIIWIKDVEQILQGLLACFDKAQEFAEQVALLEEEEIKRIFKDRAFIAPPDIIQDIEQHRLICFSENKQSVKFEKKIVFETRPQPVFNKNFSLLIDTLKEQKNEGIEHYFFVENPKQVERFYSIFEDLEANVHFHPITKAIHAGFIDMDLKIACYTDHQIFERFHRYRLKQGFTKDQALNLRMIRELQAGDFVTHLDHGIGRYSGLEKIDINGHIQESVRLVYKNNDILYVSINSLHKISKYVGKEGTAPKLNKIGSDAWKTLKKRTKKKVKDIAKELIKLYAKRKASEGFAFPQDGYLQTELEASFLYEDTPDQALATEAVKEDMMKAYPMDRLICGDVAHNHQIIKRFRRFRLHPDLLG
ncbi:MAG: CarD family transcriptional regulator [Bacteroidota bacterium]